MSTLKHTKNFATGTLTSSYTVADGVLNLTAGQGARFPTGGDFWVRLENDIYKCTSRSTDALTVTYVESLDSASESNHSAGVTVDYVVSTQALNQLRSDLCSAGAYSSTPAAERDGKLYLPSDAVHVARDNGATIDRYGPIQKLGGFQAYSGLAWINQGTATGDDTGGILTIRCLAAAGDSVKILKKALTLVGGTMTFTARMLAQLFVVNYNKAGILLRESGTGKLYLFGMGDGVINNLTVQRYTDATTFQSTRVAAGLSAPCMSIGTLLRLTYDGTTIKAYVSPDGKEWILFDSVAKTTPFTTAPDEIGIWCMSGNATYGVSASFFDWVEGA